MHGYSGKILRINLTTQEVNKEPLDEKFARKYVGGQGFGAKILYSEVPEGLDSFEPGNKIIFAVGPLAGSKWPGSS
jgi:aldehyde:ferredoxin oxidoreductase